MSVMADVPESGEEELRELHTSVENGDINSVMRLTEKHKQGQHFSFENCSALKKAFVHKQYEVFAYLVHIGATFVNRHEKTGLDFQSWNYSYLNNLLANFNRKSLKSCIHKLLSSSLSPQGIDGYFTTMLTCLYEDLLNSEITELLMRVLENENFEIIYDFQSDYIDRCYHCIGMPSEIHAFTSVKDKKIFIGAKKLFQQSEEQTEVKGRLAEQLCILAMDILYGNDKKPYRGNDSKRHRVYQRINSSICYKTYISSIRPPIGEIFQDFLSYEQFSELIGVIPHVFAVHGDEKSRSMFMEYPELSNLLSFYEENILPMCTMYSDGSNNANHQKLMRELGSGDECISLMDKDTTPFREDFYSFKPYLMKDESLWVLESNCSKLCALHVYHELKKEYKERIESKCLFFTEKCFRENENEILNAFKSIAWEYLILVKDKEDQNLGNIKKIVSMYDINTGVKRVIVILETFSFHVNVTKMPISYSWNDLNKCFKANLCEKNILFKGKERYSHPWVEEDKLSEVINEEEMGRLINGDVLEIGDGNTLFSSSYKRHSYIQREFELITVRLDVIENLPPETIMIVTYQWKYETEKFFYRSLRNNHRSRNSFDDSVQWLGEHENDIDENKTIFIKAGSGSSFYRLLKERLQKNMIWLHHDKYQNQSFLFLRKTDLDIKNYEHKITFSELDILPLLKERRALLISGNVGSGKSTLTSRMIDLLKHDPHYWLWGINLSDYALSPKNQFSLLHIKPASEDEEVFSHFLHMLKFKSALVKGIFSEMSRRRGYNIKGGSEVRCVVFLDGLNEIPSACKESVLRLFTILKEKPGIKLCITTTKQQEELEDLFGVFTCHLKPFPYEKLLHSNEDSLHEIPK